MQTINLTDHTDKRGILKLEVPIGVINRGCEIILVIQPSQQKRTKKDKRPHNVSPIDLGWEPGFFEATFGCLKDAPIVRPPQLPLEKREALQ